MIQRTSEAVNCVFSEIFHILAWFKAVEYERSDSTGTDKGIRI